MITRYECPLPKCDWTHQVDEELLLRNAIAAPGIAAVMGVPLDAFVSIRGRQFALDTEHRLEQHLKTHTVVEWLSALAAANLRIVELEALIPTHERTT